MLSGLALLFASATLAATILPLSSEVVLFALLQQGYPAAVLVAVATVGNTLGAVINWVLGRFLLHFRHRRWFYFNDRQIDRAQAWFKRYGVWTLLFAWTPVVGDALTLIGGVMNVRLWLFVVLVGVGKGLRYIALVYLVS